MGQTIPQKVKGNLGSFALAGSAIAAYDPEAMSFTRVMRVLPLAGNHWPVANFYNQVANRETRFFGHSHEVAMRPFRPVAINHVGDFGQKQSIPFQYTLGLLQERRIKIA